MTADTSFSDSVEWVASPSAPLPGQSQPPAGHQLQLAAEAAAAAAAAPVATPAGATAGVPGSEKPRGAPPPASARPRGRAVVEVAGSLEGDEAALRVHGTLSDGGSLDFSLGEEPRVGTLRADGWWVKGALGGGGEAGGSGALLLSRGKGYCVQNCRVALAAAEAHETM